LFHNAPFTIISVDIFAREKGTDTFFGNWGHQTNAKQAWYLTDIEIHNRHNRNHEVMPWILSKMEIVA
jgi:hypothetical protein